MASLAAEAISVGCGRPLPKSVSWGLRPGLFCGGTLLCLAIYPVDENIHSVPHRILCLFMATVVLLLEVVGPLLAHQNPSSFSNHFALR